MQKLPLLAVLLVLALVLAQNEVSERRVISIDSSGGSQSGNLRYGPIQYSHPDPEGIVATVSTLTIYAAQAELRGPETEGERLSLTEARGQRTASFVDGVRVTRGRLEATGLDLGYSETLGLGTLTGGVNIRLDPREGEADDPVFITALSAEFDVDNDVSISRGNVQLENGPQRAEADEIEYEEDMALGVLLCEGRQCVATRTDADGNELIISANEIRVLTDLDQLFARGDVTIIDGSITSRGDIVFFDDNRSRAEIIGVTSQAVAIDEEEGIEITGDRIEQRTDINTISLIDASLESEFTENDFLLSRERE